MEMATPYNCRRVWQLLSGTIDDMYRMQDRVEHAVKGGPQMSAYQKWMHSASDKRVHPSLHTPRLSCLVPADD
jgi:hypothetical protein